MQRKLQLDIIVKPKTDNMIIYRYKVKEILQQKSAWINVTYKNIRPKKWPYVADRHAASVAEVQRVKVVFQKLKSVRLTEGLRRELILPVQCFPWHEAAMFLDENHWNHNKNSTLRNIQQKGKWHLTVTMKIVLTPRMPWRGLQALEVFADRTLRPTAQRHVRGACWT